MKSLIVLFTILISLCNAFAKDLSEKEQLAFKQGLAASVKGNEERLKFLLDKNPEDIVGVEVIIAAGTKNGPAYSKWGHALLRFVDNDGIWSNDMTLNFVALVDTPSLSIMKGLTGGYAVLPEVKTLYDFWIQYVQTEDRPLNRYILPTTPEQIKNLLTTIRQWTEDSTKLGDYKFVGNNCVGILSKLLLEAGIIPNLTKAVIPTKFGDHLDKTLLSPFEKLEVKSPFYVLPKASKILEITSQELMSGENWPADSSEKLLANFNNDELMFIYQTITLIPKDVSSAILKKCREKNKSSNFKNFLGFSAVPEVLYHTCFDRSCASQVLAAEKKLWDTNELLQRRSKRIINAFQESDSLEENHAEYASSYKNIIETQIALGDYTELFQGDVNSLDNNSNTSRVELELKFMNDQFYIELCIKDQESTQCVVNEKLKTNLFGIQNSNEVTYKGKVVGKLFRKYLGIDVVKFEFPNSLISRLEHSTKLFIGLIAPSL